MKLTQVLPRFQTEAEEVKVDEKVMSLQAALNESTVKYDTFQKVRYNMQLLKQLSYKLSTSKLPTRSIDYFTGFWGLQRA